MYKDRGTKRSMLSGAGPIPDFIIDDLLECPECSGRTIFIHVIDFFNYTAICLSCGYDNSMENQIIFIGEL